MPHYSKREQQQRQQRLGYSPSGSSGHSLHSQSFSSSQTEYNSHSTAAVAAAASAPPPSWMPPSGSSADQEQAESADEARSTGYQQHLYHRVPVSPPEIKGGIRSTSTTANSSKDEQDDTTTSTPKSLDKDSPPSHGLAAASVMLLAAAAAKSEPSVESNYGDDDGEEKKEADCSSMSETSSRPLKKRKPVGIMRSNKNKDEDGEPRSACHVSPMSHGSAKSSTAEDAESPTTNAGDEHNKAAVQEKEVSLPHLPSLLHWILTESSSPTATPDMAAINPVLQWVSHGQAWQILRWEALRRDVLPKFLPHLCMDEKLGSLDAFLSHLMAWGFEEIKDGPDVGAYTHTLFRRGHPQLCQDMKYNPDKDLSSEVRGPDSTRNILRVPSLGSASTDPGMPRSRVGVVDSSSAATSITSPPRADYGWSASKHMRSIPPPVFVNYRPEDMYNQGLTGDPWQYKGPQPWMPPTHSATTPAGSHPSTLPNQNAMRGQGMPPYSPIRIRSGRGARRLPATSGPSIRTGAAPITAAEPASSATRRASASSATGNTVNVAAGAAATNTATVTSPTRGFVSNRGKGRRSLGLSSNSNVRNRSSPSNDDSAASTTIAMLSEKESSSTSTTEVMKSNTNSKEAEATKKTEAEQRPRSMLKRKLPLASSSAPPSSEK